MLRSSESLTVTSVRSFTQWFSQLSRQIMKHSLHRFGSSVKRTLDPTSDPGRSSSERRCLEARRGNSYRRVYETSIEVRLAGAGDSPNEIGVRSAPGKVSLFLVPFAVP